MEYNVEVFGTKPYRFVRSVKEGIELTPHPSYALRMDYDKAWSIAKQVEREKIGLTHVVPCRSSLDRLDVLCTDSVRREASCSPHPLPWILYARVIVNGEPVDGFVGQCHSPDADIDYVFTADPKHRNSYLLPMQSMPWWKIDWNTVPVVSVEGFLKGLKRG